MAHANTYFHKRNQSVDYLTTTKDIENLTKFSYHRFVLYNVFICA